jgi:LysM repeat protein
MVYPVEKARITNLDVGEDDYIECLFNPNQYVYKRDVSWTPHQVKGGDLPWFEFAGGSSATLSMDLFLDTTTNNGNILDTLKEFRKLMMVYRKEGETSAGRPPLVKFSWGQGLQFEAVITSITETCTLFQPNGIPVRATLGVSFLQCEKSQLSQDNRQEVAAYKKSPAPIYRQYTVKEGDTLDSIASREYGDETKWRFIADSNGLVDPTKLRPGDKLAIRPVS